jgi:hypothetical protein
MLTMWSCFAAITGRTGSAMTSRGSSGRCGLFDGFQKFSSSREKTYFAFGKVGTQRPSSILEIWAQLMASDPVANEP